MSTMSDLHLDIADEIELGELSYRNIAIKYGVTYQEVDQLAKDLREFDVDFGDDKLELPSIMTLDE